MPPDRLHFTDYQATFAARIRDPQGAPRPAGVPEKRMRVYEALLFNNLENFLLACYPVTRQILGARTWRQTLRRFFSTHRCHSPLFRDIPKAFLDWMQQRGAALFPKRPFLAEFMHYEWLELAVSVSPEEADPAAIDADGDLLLGRPALHPSARLACYRYPVHRIGPAWQPDSAQAAMPRHCYLLFRAQGDELDGPDDVRFILLNPLAARLLQRLLEQPLGGRQALTHLFAERDAVNSSGHVPNQYGAFVQAGGELLQQLRAQGALLGTWREK